MAKISIIIPVYNAEKYLDDCMDSVLNQTFEDFELILVNDGSTDRSGELCDEYAKNDKRIKVVHTENNGQGSARNTGIDMATGEYIGFVDCDDYIDYDMYEVLYDNMVRENADLSMCALVDIFPGKIIHNKGKDDFYIMDSREAIKTVMEAEITSVTPVNKLYKRSLFKDIRFPVGQDMGEDAAIMIDLIMLCDKVVLTAEEKYYYVHRGSSSTLRPFEKKDLSVIKVYKKNYKTIMDNYPDLMQVAGMRICWAYFFVLDKLLMSSNRAEFKNVEDKCVAFLRKHYRFIMRDKHFHKGRKIAMMLLNKDVKLYKACVSYMRKNRGL